MDEILHCRDALEQLALLDFTKWHGLSELCQPEDFKAVFDGGDAEAVGRLSNQPQLFRVYSKENVSSRIEVWFHHDTKKFMMATITYPEFKGDTTALLRT